MARHQSLHARIPKRGQEGPAAAAWLPRKSTTIMILAVFLGSSLGKVYLDRRTVKMRQEWSQQHDRLVTTRKESENLQMELERYMSGTYVLPRARQLGLRPSDPGQIQFIKNEADNSATAAGQAEISNLKSQI